MGKYTTSSVKKGANRKKTTHYVWQGLGCLMMIIIPLISYAAGQITVDMAIENEWDLPREYLGIPKLPAVVNASSGLYTLFGWVTNIENFYAILVFTIVYIIVIGGIMSLMYTIVYSYMAPPRYGPQDLPPPNFKTKKFKR